MKVKKATKMILLVALLVGLASASGSVIGVALDLSLSMKEPFQIFQSKGSGIETSISRIRNVLNIVAKRLPEVQDTDNYQYFGLAFGLKEHGIGDLLHMIDWTTKRVKISRELLHEYYVEEPSPSDSWEEVIVLLETTGAPYVRKYAKEHIHHFTHGLAKFVLPFLRESCNGTFSRESIEVKRAIRRNYYHVCSVASATMIPLFPWIGGPAFGACQMFKIGDVTADCEPAPAGLLKDLLGLLPPVCKEIMKDTAYGASQIMVDDRSKEDKVKELISDTLEIVESLISRRIEDEKYHTSNFIVSDISIYSARVLKDEIFRNWDQFMGKDDKIGDNEADPAGILSSKIYGSTPMCAALRKIIGVFDTVNRNDKKVLLIISDGEPTDCGAEEALRLATVLKSRGVILVACFISRYAGTDQRRLFYRRGSWERGANLMFDMSSSLHNSHPGFKLLLDEGWFLPVEGESRLFVQANNEKTIETFVEVVKRIGSSDDALLDIITRAEMDKFITGQIYEYKATDQGGKGICYAHAAATAFVLAMRRIKYRSKGYPTFESIKDELVNKYTKGVTDFEKVLIENCPKYRLQYRKLSSEIEARTVFNMRRPVIAVFSLLESLEDEEGNVLQIGEWGRFSQFYYKNKDGILTRDVIVGPNPVPKRVGHVVILINIAPDYLEFINSWGPGFADNGRFKVKDASVLGIEFYDVFWTLNDLTQEEKDAYEKETSCANNKVCQ